MNKAHLEDSRVSQIIRKHLVKSDGPHTLTTDDGRVFTGPVVDWLHLLLPRIAELAEADCARLRDLPATRAQIVASPEVRALVEAATELKADLISRGECRVKKATGETAYLVNAGRSAWHDFCAALAAFNAMEAGG